MMGTAQALASNSVPLFCQGTGESLDRTSRGLSGGESLVEPIGVRSRPSPGILLASSTLPLFRRCKRHFASLILKEARCLTDRAAASGGGGKLSTAWGPGRGGGLLLEVVQSWATVKLSWERDHKSQGHQRGGLLGASGQALTMAVV